MGGKAENIQITKKHTRKALQILEVLPREREREAFLSGITVIEERANGPEMEENR